MSPLRPARLAHVAPDLRRGLRYGIALAVTGLGLAITPAPAAHADLCPYPGTGVAASVLFGRGGYCDYPMEINGSHMHCEAGGAGLGGTGGLTGSGDLGTASLGLGGFGVGGTSCTWRCPDGTMAPQPNPPGVWNKYLPEPVPTAFCVIEGHMTPNGFTSAPVLPTEGEPSPPQQMQIVPPGAPTP